MTLLRDIQDAATGTEVPVTTLLRKAQILAARLDHAPLRQWASAELDGYKDREALPEYRRLGGVTVIGDFSGAFGTVVRNAPIPMSNVPEEYRERLFTHDVYESVARLEALVSRPDGAIEYPWPPDFVAALAQDFYEAMVAVQIVKAISPSVLTGILDTVRNRLLAFALDIERLDSEAGDTAPGAPVPISSAAVTQIFNTTISGGQVSLATAGQGDVSQQVTQTIGDPRTIEDITASLREWGLPGDEIRDLEFALSEDRDSAGGGEVVVGDKTQSWIGRLATRVAAGSVKVAENVSVDVIVALLNKAAGG